MRNVGMHSLKFGGTFFILTLHHLKSSSINLQEMLGK
jgi:hypothetical protein